MSLSANQVEQAKMWIISCRVIPNLVICNINRYGWKYYQMKILSKYYLDLILQYHLDSVEQQTKTNVLNKNVVVETKSKEHRLVLLSQNVVTALMFVFNSSL